MYIYHALINAQNVHIIHINLNTIFYTHVEDSPTNTVYTRHYIKITRTPAHKGSERCREEIALPL